MFLNVITQTSQQIMLIIIFYYMSYQVSDQIQKIIEQLKWVNKQQAAQIESYQLATQSFQRERKQLNLLLRQYGHDIRVLEKQITELKKENNDIRQELQSLKAYLNLYQIKYENLANVKSSIQKSKINLAKSDYQKVYIKTFFKQNNKIQDSYDKDLQKIQSQYVIEPIKFKKERKINKKLIQSRFKELQKVDEKIPNRKFTQNLAQNFFIIGPDTNQFNLIIEKKSMNEQQITLNPMYLYQYYKQNSEACIIRPDILIRSFPKKVKLKKLKIETYNYQIRSIIQYQPNCELNQDYFVFNMRGQQQRQKRKQKKPSRQNEFLDQVNINQQIYILCLKLKDIIVTKSNPKKNIQSEIWMTQKVYAIVSYFPFFDTHIKLMAELEKINYLCKLKILQESIQKYITITLDSNIKLFLRNQKINQLLNNYMNKSPASSSLCEAIQPYGTIINQSQASYMQATFASGILFSNISYEQFLLILTAILCQKVVVFISKCACISTFSALTFLGLIYPFKYPHAKILNADPSKLDTIFQSPFPLIASITVEQSQMKQIIEQFVQANIDNQKSIHVIVDLDSNTILLDKVLRNDLQKMIPSPHQTLKILYMEHNSCRAKSLFLTKQMQTITGVLTFNQKRTRTKQQQTQQIKKLLEREFNQEIEQNKTKFILWKSDFKLVQEFRKFMSKFSIMKLSRKFSKNQDPKDEINRLKKKMIDQNLEYRHFLVYFLNTQIFTCDLDNKIYY